MICPACGSVYVEGACECSEGEGGVFLPLMESSDVVLFSRVTARLEEMRISWFVQGEESLATGAGWPEGQVVVIYVAAERFEEARAVVKDLDPVGATVDA